MTGTAGQSVWLAALAFDGLVHHHAELHGRWGARAGCDNPGLYVLQSGRVQLEVAGQRFVLHEGDTAVLLGGQRHTISDRAGSEVVDFPELARRMQPSERGHVLTADRARPADATILSALTFGRSGTAARFQCLLPAALILRPAELERPFRLALEALQAECARGALGDPEVTRRLGEVVCMNAVRQLGPSANDIDALVIGSAWAALEALEQPWSVAALGRRAGLSRSRYSERFVACLGEPPMSWLRRQRMQRAAAMLATGTVSVREVAERFGYASEAAFRKTFRRALGRPARAALL